MEEEVDDFANDVIIEKIDCKFIAPQEVERKQDEEKYQKGYEFHSITDIITYNTNNLLDKLQTYNQVHSYFRLLDKSLLKPQKPILLQCGLRLQVSKITLSTNLYMDLNLMEAACCISDCIFAPHVTGNPELHMELHSLGVTVHITKKGYIQVHAKSCQQAKEALKRCCMKLKLAKKRNPGLISNVPIDHLPKQEIVSITAHTTLDFQLQSLEAFDKKYWDHDSNYTVVYDADLSPTLSISNEQEHLHMTISTTGKVMFMGAKSIKSIVDCLEYWYRVLKENRRRDIPRTRKTQLNVDEEDLENNEKDLSKRFKKGNYVKEANNIFCSDLVKLLFSS